MSLVLGGYVTFVAKLGGVSTLRPKAARLRDPPPKDVFGSFPNKSFLYLEIKQNLGALTEKGQPYMWQLKIK